MSFFNEDGECYGDCFDNLLRGCDAGDGDDWSVKAIRRPVEPCKAGIFERTVVLRLWRQ
jgi:hypothetical protein